MREDSPGESGVLRIIDPAGKTLSLQPLAHETAKWLWEWGVVTIAGETGPTPRRGKPLDDEMHARLEAAREFVRKYGDKIEQLRQM